MFYCAAFIQNPDWRNARRGLIALKLINATPYHRWNVPNTYFQTYRGFLHNHTSIRWMNEWLPNRSLTLSLSRDPSADICNNLLEIIISYVLTLTLWTGGLTKPACTVRQVVDTYLDSQWLKNAPPPQLMISTLLSYFGSIGMALAALQIVIILCHGVSTYNLKQPIRKLCRQWPSLGDYFRDMRSS